MGRTIANQATPSQVSGRLATWHRVMEEAGLEYEDLQVPIDDPNFRSSLVEFWRRRGAVVAASDVDAIVFPTISTAEVVEAILADWANFYREIGVEVDLSELRVPTRREGFGRLIVVAKGMSPERVFQKCREHFQCWKYMNESLDEIVFDRDGVDRKFRRSDHETHAVWVRDRDEADKELKNRSANDLAASNIPGITLEACELYELKYFKETGKHLDRKNVTLCAGSRFVDGHVPGVHWSGRSDEMDVLWYDPSRADDVLRSREQVS